MQDVSHYRLFSYTGALIKWNRQTCLQLRLRTRAQLYKCLYNNRRLQNTANLMDKVQAAYHDYSKRLKNSQHTDTRVHYIWSKLNKELNDVTNSRDI